MDLKYKLLNNLHLRIVSSWGGGQCGQKSVLPLSYFCISYRLHFKRYIKIHFYLEIDENIFQHMNRRISREKQ